MNLAIFITKANREEMREVCTQLAAKQTTPVNGALCVIHQAQVAAKDVAELTRELAARFKVKVALPVSANLSQKHDAQLALLFSRFLLGAYARYPGPWLLMDEPAQPREDNFMQLLDKQHAAYGGRITGKGLVDKGSLLPTGPITLDIPYAQLKFLKFSTNESWRSRGKFFFARCGFAQIPHGQYLFDFRLENPAYKDALEPKMLIHPDVMAPEGTGTFRGPMVEGEPQANLSRFSKEDQEAAVAHASPEGNPGDVDVDDAPDHPAAINANIPAHVIPAPTRKELMDAVIAITGKRPPNFTSEAKLKAMIEQSPSTPA